MAYAQLSRLQEEEKRRKEGDLRREEEIEALEKRVTLLEAQGDTLGEVAELEDRLNHLSTELSNLAGRMDRIERPPPVEEPKPVEAPLPPAPPPALFAPDIFYGDSFAKFPQTSEGALIQPLSAVTLMPDGRWRERVDDSTGLNITSNPRAEMISAPIPAEALKLGFWWGLAWEFPEDFPTSIPGWWNIAEFYGEPFAGSPTIEIDLRGNGVGWHTNSEGGNKDVWRSPYKPGTKETALLHIQPNQVEVWHNGEIAAVATIKTVGAANATGPQHCYIQNYRQKGMFPQAIDIFHWPLAVGTTRQRVEYSL
jgi:hypothetical protein